MITFLFIGLFVICFIIIKEFRCFCFNLPFSLAYLFKDIYYYFMRKLFNTAPYGYIDCYCAEFGGGKTLSAVNKVCQLYYKYNDKRVFHPELKKMVTQKIQILSNVELVNVPYVPLVSMEQFIKACDVKAEKDKENETLTITYLIGDEFSSQMNSRNFKNNIPSVLLNKILTSRHYFCSWFITSQRFNQVDKIIRDSTRYVIQCKKRWRFLLHDILPAWELENCNNPLIIEPIRSDIKWINDKMYLEYNTFACVDNLQDDYKNGKYLSDQEVLALRSPTPSDSGSVHLKKKFLKRNRR